MRLIASQNYQWEFYPAKVAQLERVRLGEYE